MDKDNIYNLKEAINITKKTEDGLTRRFSESKKALLKRGIDISRVEGTKGKDSLYFIIFVGYELIPEIKGHPKKRLVDFLKLPKDLSNKTFGELTALYIVDNPTKGNHCRWLCKCRCETYTEVDSTHLIQGETTKCNECGRKEAGEKNTINLIGQRFGKLVVIEKDKDRYIQPNGDTQLKWICKCDCGKIKSILGHNLRDGNVISCGCLDSSKGEFKISQILIENKIDFKTEYIFSNCIFPESKGKLRFDFYLPNYNCCIEYDGMQHFNYTGYDWNTKENFEKTKKRDEYKNQWCRDNKIILIRIPYTYYNNITIKDLLPETSSFIVEKGGSLNGTNVDM